MLDQDQNVEPIVDEYHERTYHRWFAILLYGFMALVVAFIVVFGGRAIYRHYHPAIKTVPANTKALPPQPSASGSEGSNNQASGNQSSSTQQAGSLPNSGPGQVIGLFIGASFAAASLHYIVNLQKQTHSSTKS